MMYRFFFILLLVYGCAEPNKEHPKDVSTYMDSAAQEAIRYIDSSSKVHNQRIAFMIDSALGPRLQKLESLSQQIHPVRHSRHRKGLQWLHELQDTVHYIYKHEEEINDVVFPDYMPTLAQSIDSLTLHVIRNQDSITHALIKDIRKYTDSISKTIHH